MTARAFYIGLAVVLAAAVVAIGVFAPRASAAERFLPGAYDLNAYKPVSQYANPREPGALGPQNVVRIETYDSRELCLHAAQFVKVSDGQIGWRLRCDPIERGPQ